MISNTTNVTVNGNCTSTFTNLTFTNNTNSSAVTFFNFTNFSVCNNCTNITDTNSGNFSTPFFNQTNSTNVSFSLAPTNFSSRVTNFAFCNLTNIRIEDTRFNSTIDGVNFNVTNFTNIQITQPPNVTLVPSSEFSNTSVLIIVNNTTVSNFSSVSFAQLFANGTGNGTRNDTVGFDGNNSSDPRTKHQQLYPQPVGQRI